MKDEGYFLHFPFQWAGNIDHDGFEGRAPADAGIRLQLKKALHGESEIVLSGLPDLAFAEACLNRCWFALLCVSALRRCSVKAELGMVTPQPFTTEVRTGCNPGPASWASGANRIVQAGIPFIAKSSDRVARVGGSATVTFGPARIGEDLLSWMWHVDFAELAGNGKLCLALELANLAGYEAPIAAKFVLTMSAIEALLPEEGFPESVRAIVAGWQEALEEQIQSEDDPGAKEQLQLLFNQTTWLTQPSISSRFRKFANRLPPEGASQDYDKVVKSAYRLRSDLVHKGFRDDEQLSRAYPVVDELLRRAIRAELGTGAKGGGT